MVEFEIDWMFFFVLFIVFITAGLVTGKNEHDKKLEKEKQVEILENMYII